MVYVTVMQPPMYRQMSIEELLFNTGEFKNVLNGNVTNTRTDAYDELPPRIAGLVNVNKLIKKLEEFNASTEHIRSRKRSELYCTFLIPKKSGHGVRRIDAPCPELMEYQRNLDKIFKNDFRALYHTSAFAYIKGRCAVDAVKRHQANESKWFEKDDLSNFFGNTTMAFVINMFSMIFPFSEVVKVPRGRIALETALDIAFLNGGLPQGTPISPAITNIMMIPVDHKLANGFRNLGGHSFVYTRYADDFMVSSRHNFNGAEIRQFIIDTLNSFDSPFNINPEKSRYGSSAGRNWNLGVMLNKDNQITIGAKRKRQFQAMLSSYVLDRMHGNSWPLEDVQVLEGHRNYYRMVEGETIDRIVDHVCKKYNVDIIAMIKTDLKT